MASKRSEGIGREFLRGTTYEHLSPSGEQRGRRQPPLVLDRIEKGDRRPLPPPDRIGLEPLDFHGLVTRRASLRSYARTPLDEAELSFLLWCTQGVKRQREGIGTLRTVPSAGARHALDTLILAHRVEGIAPGLWGFHPLEHALVPLEDRAGLADDLAGACLNQAMVATSAVTFAWVAVPERMTWRYAERGWRYLFLDAGHVGQNLYLASEAIGCGACAIAAYDDAAVNRVLDLDGESEFAIYLAAVGKRA